MSSWHPMSAGPLLRRELPCEGGARAVATVERVQGPDGFNYLASAACDAGRGTLICQAKACSAIEAQVIADALGKYVRHAATRKARKDARREMRRCCAARDAEGGGE